MPQKIKENYALEPATQNSTENYATGAWLGFIGIVVSTFLGPRKVEKL